jgi:hypothetical protein
MKVFELIELLKEMPQDLEVYSYCDHGQSPEKTSTPSIAFTEKANEFCLWDDYTTDEDDAEESGYTQKVVLL